MSSRSKTVKSPTPSRRSGFSNSCRSERRALARLGGIEPRELEGSIKGFGISGGMGSLFATHPSIEERIAALREHRY